MLPVLIYYVLKRYNVVSISDSNLLKFKTKLHKILVFVLLLVLTTTQAFNNPNNETPKVFQIIKNNKVIGSIDMKMRVSGDSIIYISESQINAKMILTFKIIGKEISVFKSGVLVYSSVYRKLNNKVKVDHNIALLGSNYNLCQNNKTELLDIKKIEKNLISLYFKEPKGIISIFCDNQKEMIQIRSLGGGTYKVEISKDKYNIFHYVDGKCVKVEAFSPLFDVVLIPTT